MGSATEVVGRDPEREGGEVGVRVRAEGGGVEIEGFVGLFERLAREEVGDEVLEGIAVPVGVVSSGAVGHEGFRVLSNAADGLRARDTWGGVRRGGTSGEAGVDEDDGVLSEVEIGADGVGGDVGRVIEGEAANGFRRAAPVDAVAAVDEEVSALSGGGDLSPGGIGGIELGDLNAAGDELIGRRFGVGDFSGGPGASGAIDGADDDDGLEGREGEGRRGSDGENFVAGELRRGERGGDGARRRGAIGRRSESRSREGERSEEDREEG
ncbi:MAG: hypothetical protein AB9888_13285 [Bacteroidales bacterium]